MKVYFTADNQAPEEFQKRFSRLTQILNEAGILVMSNLAQKSGVAGFSSQDLARIDQSGEVLLEKINALIIEGTRPIPESGYLIALALTHKKPILYLLEKGKLFNKNLLYLTRDKNAARLLHLKHYTDHNLDKVLADFLPIMERVDGRQLASIKFTLRITPRIERYLRWKTHNTKISKADYLREIIEQLIDADEDYRKLMEREEE